MDTSLFTILVYLFNQISFDFIKKKKNEIFKFKMNIFPKNFEIQSLNSIISLNI